MRISDWSSDVCSSDLVPLGRQTRHARQRLHRPGRDRAAAGDRRLLLARRLPVGSRIYGPGLLVLPAVDGHLAVHPPPPSRWGKATVRRAALSPAAGALLPEIGRANV